MPVGHGQMSIAAYPNSQSGRWAHLAKQVCNRAEPCLAALWVDRKSLNARGSDLVDTASRPPGRTISTLATTLKQIADSNSVYAASITDRDPFPTRETVPAESRTGVKRLKPERLSLCRIDNFPNVDAHPVIQHFKFVHQRNVD